VTETVATLACDGYNMRRWCLVEHIGSHLDAPIHDADDGASANRLKIEDLVVPMVVVDIAGVVGSLKIAGATGDTARDLALV
jgi:kynurenine formamidase